jgi:hypothetical protein
MKTETESLRIPMQVGSALRIKNTGAVVVDNPEVELAETPSAADAVLSYRFDPQTGEHILTLLEPVANWKHLREHRPGD